MPPGASGSPSGERERAAPIALPGTSFVPLACALGLVIAIVGLVNSWVIFAVGAAVFGVALLRWIDQIS